MSPELSDALCKDFPILYGDDFHFEVPDRWEPILRRLSALIESDALVMRKAGVPDDELPKAVQVKEKFGSLRFYLYNETDAICSYIMEAEDAVKRLEDEYEQGKI